MAIDYPKYFTEMGLHGYTFFGYKGRDIVKIVETTPRAADLIRKAIKAGKAAGKTWRDDESDRTAVVPQWAYTECDGPQNWAQFRVTQFKTPELEKKVRVALNIQQAPPPERPKAKTPKNLVAFELEDEGGSVWPEPEPAAVTTEPDLYTSPPVPEPQAEPEPAGIDLTKLRMAELRAYAMQNGMAEEDAKSYRGNKGKEALIIHLQSN